MEGLFGEWSGYFTGQRNQPAVNVEAVYYRNQPIMLGNPPGRPPYQPSAGRYLSIVQAETTLDTVRKSVPGVKDIFTHAFAGASGITAISIEQRYPGHAREAGASMVMRGNYLAIVVVDDDVNIRDVNELFWAVCTRLRPRDGLRNHHQLSGHRPGPTNRARHPAGHVAGDHRRYAALGVEGPLS